MQTERVPGGAATRSNVRERAIEIGLAILDAEGADALTLKRIAGIIGVRPPALHWHFRDRHALLEEILEAALGRIDFADTGQAWEDQVVALAGSLFAAMPPVTAVAGALAPGPIASWPGMDRLLELLDAQLRRGDLDESTRDEVRQAVLSIIAGFGLSAIGRSAPAEREADGRHVANSVRFVLAGARSGLPAAR